MNKPQPVEEMSATNENIVENIIENIIETATAEKKTAEKKKKTTEKKKKTAEKKTAAEKKTGKKIKNADVVVNADVVQEPMIVDAVDAEAVQESMIVDVVSPLLHKKKVVELKELCKSRGLKVPSRAKKADILRLLSAGESVEQTRDYRKMTVVELKAQCKEQNIKYDSKVKKVDLIALLESTTLSKTNIDIEVILYEDGVRRTFENMSGKEIDSVIFGVADFFRVMTSNVNIISGPDHSSTITEEGEPVGFPMEERMIIKNVKSEYVHLNKKQKISVPQYSVNEWGSLEIECRER